MIDEALRYIQANKAITLIDEILAEFPELTAKELATPEIQKELENNRIRMKAALKIKLFKANTTESLLKLNKMLENETNQTKTGEFIDKIVERWKKNEL